VKHPLIK